jgi:hypothetical protein
VDPKISNHPGTIPAPEDVSVLEAVLLYGQQCLCSNSGHSQVRRVARLACIITRDVCHIRNMVQQNRRPDVSRGLRSSPVLVRPVSRAIGSCPITHSTVRIVVIVRNSVHFLTGKALHRVP